MNLILKSLVLLVIAVPVFGQELNSFEADFTAAKSTVMVGEFRTADSAILSPREDGRVDIFVSNLDDFSRCVATVDLPFKSPIVRAFEVDADGYRPVMLQPTKTPGKFTLDKPGTWTVEVFGVKDGALTIDILDGIIIPSSRPPVEPVPVPDDPIPTPELSALTDLTVSTLKVVNDPDVAKEYLSGIKALTFEGELSDMITKVTLVRKTLLVGEVKGQWYKFFQMIDDEFSEVKTVEQYEQHWAAVIAGMEMYLDPGSSPMSYLNQRAMLPRSSFSFPSSPTLNQRYRGYQYQKTSCDTFGNCTYGWVLTN